MNALFASLDKSLNNIHQLASSLLNDDHVHSFYDILEMAHEKTAYQNFVECLAKETHNFLHVLSPSMINNIFKEGTSLTLETSPITWLYLQKTVRFETETIT